MKTKTERKYITRHQMKSKISRWVNKVAKQIDNPEVKELYRFEDDHFYKGDFAFYYDGILYDLIKYGAIYCEGYKLFKELGTEFDNLFEGVGWGFDFIEASVGHCFKEF